MSIWESSSSDSREFREDGVYLKLYKLIAFMISTFFAGVAGALFVGFSHAVYPTYASVMKSTILMLICILGGMCYC